MLWVEWLKIFKRKFNYIYMTATALLILVLTIFEMNYNITDIKKEEFIYNYNLKLILVLAIIFIVINIISSYRKDYKDRVNKLIRFSKVSRFYNLLSKVLVNKIVGLIYYSTLMVLYIAVLYILNGPEIVLNTVAQNNVVLSITLLFFVTNLSLMMVVIFNSIHVAIPATVLFLTSLTYIRDFAKNTYNINWGGDIFSDSFFKISSTNSSLELYNIVQLLIYSVCIFFIALIVKLIKNN